LFEMRCEKRSFTRDLFLSICMENLGLTLLEFGEQKSQFRISIEKEISIN
jgi:hypothetical protein